MVVHYSTAAESVLLKAGWSPERCIPIEHWVVPLELEGFALSQFAAEILHNLGGLKVCLPVDLPSNPFEHKLIFDPLYAGSGEYDSVEEWQKELKTRLFPIAHVTCAYPVWMADDGAVYYGLGWGLYSLGTSFGEALSRLLKSDIGPAIA
jgi:hypothetical protein